MHQKSLFGDQKSKKNFRGGELGLPQTLSLPPKLAVSKIDAGGQEVATVRYTCVVLTISSCLTVVGDSRRDAPGAATTVIDMSGGVSDVVP